MYYLSWLRNKILHNDPEVEKKQGWTTVGDLEGCVHYKVGRWRPSFHDASFPSGCFCFEDSRNKSVFPHSDGVMNGEVPSLRSRKSCSSGAVTQLNFLCLRGPALPGGISSVHHTRSAVVHVIPVSLTHSSHSNVKKKLMESPTKIWKKVTKSLNSHICLVQLD